MTALAPVEIVGLANPYFDAFLTLTRGLIREEFLNPWPMETYERVWRFRRTAARYYAWAIPSEAALRTLAQAGPLVEIGAGGGYWTALLRQRGGDVVAYDIAPGSNHWVHRLWTDVEIGGARDAEAHPDRTLFLCWPPYESRMAFLALAAYTRAGGRRVVYVGEHEGGCCGDDAFFGRLERDYRQVRELAIPQYPGMHDYLTVWERT